MYDGGRIIPFLKSQIGLFMRQLRITDWDLNRVCMTCINSHIWQLFVNDNRPYVVNILISYRVRSFYR